MAAQISFSDKILIEILRDYNLGQLLRYEPITKGSVQTNLFLKTTRGKFVFRLYKNRSGNSVSFEVNLIKYLKDEKFPCPRLFSNKNGKIIGEYESKPFVIFEFIEGEHIEEPNEIQKKQLIKLAAELQKITRNYRPLYKNYRWNYNAELCKELAQTEANKINTVNSKEKLTWLESEVSKLILPSSLPKGICHCDFHFSNVLFKNGKIRALIDFDDANYTYLMYDLTCLIEPFKATFNR